MESEQWEYAIIGSYQYRFDVTKTGLANIIQYYSDWAGDWVDLKNDPVVVTTLSAIYADRQHRAQLAATPTSAASERDLLESALSEVCNRIALRPDGVASDDYDTRRDALAVICGEVLALYDGGTMVKASEREARLVEAIEQARDLLHYINHFAPGYDWNADPLSITLKEGEMFAAIDVVLSQYDRPKPIYDFREDDKRLRDELQNALAALDTPAPVVDTSREARLQLKLDALLELFYVDDYDGTLRWMQGSDAALHDAIDDTDIVEELYERRLQLAKGVAPADGGGEGVK